MNRRKLGKARLLGVVFAGVASFAPLAARAQVAAGGIVTAAPQSIRVRTGGPTNSCAQIANMPSMLTQTPEGRSLMKMQRELSSVAANIAQRSDTAEGLSDLRRVTLIRQDVDSLARVYVRNMDAPPRMMFVQRMPDSMRVGMMLKTDTTGARITVRGGDGNFSFTQARGNVPEDIAMSRVQMENMIRDLEPRVAQITRPQQSPMQFKIIMSHSSGARGFIGVTASGDFLTTNINGEESIAYCDYPVVETVEDGSPADKAGVQTGDTLLAYNNHDLRAFDVNYARLLVPGTTVHMRLRRSGKVRDVPLVVARRPDAASAQAQPTPCNDGDAECEARMVRGFMLPSPTVSARVIPRTGMASGAVAVAPAEPMLPRPGMLIVPLTNSTASGANIAGFAGAQLSAISEEFAANVGVEPGLLVISVTASSPSADAGIRAGDVISAVNGLPVRDVAALRRALMVKAADRTATLQLAAKNAASRTAAVQSGARSVVVRW